MSKEIKDHIATLERFNEYLEDMGHDFWHCGAVDNEKKTDFYYVSINRVKHMSTCGNCQQRIINNRKIKQLSKLIKQ